MLPHVVVFPAIVLWPDALVARWSPLLALARLLATLALVALAGHRLARRDVP